MSKQQGISKVCSTLNEDIDINCLMSKKKYKNVNWRIPFATDQESEINPVKSIYLDSMEASLYITCQDIGTCWCQWETTCYSKIFIFSQTNSIDG